jgi:serine/threonine protein kinase
MLASHPGLASELAAFFSDHDKVHSWTAPVLETLRPADAETTVDAAAGAKRDDTAVLGVKLGTFGDYELLEEIGRGGMSVVYKAQQLSLNRLVAVKMIRADRLSTEADLRRFRHEAETVARLDHPGTVPIYEVGQWDAEGLDAPILYFSMKLLEGGDLTALCRAGPEDVDQRRVAQLLASAARALHHAHEQGILHRDLKPSNILLDREGQAHVTDFGLALSLERDLSLTQTGAIVGTPGYMSPEQTLGRRDLTPATDVYGLGAVLYALLTGRPPFKGNSTLDTLLHVKERDPDPPSLWNWSLDRTLEAICLKCLAKEPGQRYASAAALADDLDNWLAGEATVARPERWSGKVRRILRRQRSKVVVAATVALTGTVLIAASTLFQGPSPEEKETRRQQEALKSIERDLAVGKPAQLIGETGGPSYFQWRTAQASQMITQSADGAFAIQSWEYGLLELLGDPQCDSYRFQAEVRHESANDIHGLVGIYFAYSSFATDASNEHCYCKVDYSDKYDRKKGDPNWPHPGNPASLILQTHHEQPSLENHIFDPSIETFFLPCDPRNPADWRQLAVEVRPSDIRLFWIDDPPRVLARENIRSYARQNLRLPTGSVPEFAPRAALGLYVFRSAASFRNVVVKPLQENE